MGGSIARVGIFSTVSAETGPGGSTIRGAVVPLVVLSGSTAWRAVVPLVSGFFTDRNGARFWGGNG